MHIRSGMIMNKMKAKDIIKKKKKKTVKTNKKDR